jgi:hypothetical protein
MPSRLVSCLRVLTRCSREVALKEAISNWQLAKAGRYAPALAKGLGTKAEESRAKIQERKAKPESQEPKAKPESQEPKGQRLKSL